MASEFLDGRARERLRLRLATWLRQYLQAELAPLHRVAAAATGDGAGAKLSGPARGLLFQISESMGLLPRRVATAQLRGLTKADRKALAALGLRLGRECVFLPALLEPGPARLGALLCTVHGKRPLPELPAPGALAFEPGPDFDDALCRALGYRRLENGTAVALRADALERLAHEAYRLSEQGFFAPTPKLRRVTGCGEAELETALVAIGYRVRRDDTGVSFGRARPRKAPKPGAKRRARKGPGSGPSADSPFAKLRDLEPGNTNDP